MHMGYYPGCSLLGSAREFNESVRAVCDAIDLRLEEVPDWNCCGASSAHALNYDLALALPARILAQAEAAGLLLETLGFTSDCIYTTLENRMKCGLGKCGRCNTGKELHLQGRSGLYPGSASGVASGVLVDSGHFRMQGVLVRLGIDGYRLDAHFAGGFDNPAGNLLRLASGFS